MTEPESKATKLFGGEAFSFAEAVGGWRGLVESALPGIVYVAVFMFTKTWFAPTIAALGVVAVLVIIRLIQGGKVTQSLSGVVGVGIGAIWAWRTGNATNFYAGGLWIAGAYLTGVLISMAVRWPVAGIVMGLVHGTGTAWRANPVDMRRAQIGSAVVAAMFAIRLAVQLPLYWADETVALGTAKLVLGTPLFALTLWVTWLIVRNVGRKPEPQDQLPQP